MSDLYHVTGYINIVVRADSFLEASEISCDVANEMSELKVVDQIVVTINKLVIPEDGGKGYLYPSEPTETFILKLH